ncbi:hypothetical protein FM109_06345 [Vibrio casei]|nr:hypothetical protein FM109_06345 [Vibrio casei]
MRRAIRSSKLESDEQHVSELYSKWKRGKERDNKYDDDKFMNKTKTKA